MRTALEALESLPETERGIDARSVRAAIEQDALQQALMFENELRDLKNSMSNLRESVGQISRAAARVSEAIESDVMCVGKAKLGQEESTEQEKNADEKKTKMTSSIDEEHNLALVLANAFRARDDALERAIAIETFLEKFDLTDDDNYLLEHYNFHEFNNKTLSNESNDKFGNGIAFLEAIENVRRIRIELTKTFGSSSDMFQSSSTRLGASSALRMMESLAAKQEKAYDMLYHWLQSYLNLGLSSVAHVPTSSSMVRKGARNIPQQIRQPVIDHDAIDEALAHPFVKRALAILKYMPSFHSHTLELIATQRRGEVTRRFLLALTSGPNPIEMKAHDPVNYVGDMLAFVFRSLSIESDLAYGLLDETASQINDDYSSEGVGDETDNLVVTAKPMTSIEMLSIAMSGVTRPLKARISQVISSLARRVDDEEDEDIRETPSLSNVSSGMIDDEVNISRNRISSLYSISGLLIFYHSAILKSLNKLNKNTESKNKHQSDTFSEKYKLNLLDSLLECLNETSASYAASIRVYAAMLQTYASSAHGSEATLANNIIQLLSETRASSPGFSLDAHCPLASVQTTLSLDYLCDIILEVAIPLCKTLDDCSTIKSVIATAKKAGLNSIAITKWTKLISVKELKMIDDFIGIQTIEVLYSCGIGEIYDSIMKLTQDSHETTLLSLQPNLNQQNHIEPAFKRFYASLYSPPIPSFEEMKDPILRRQSRTKTASNVAEGRFLFYSYSTLQFCAAYEVIYHTLKSDRGGYDDLSFLLHSPHQVKTLLSI